MNMTQANGTAGDPIMPGSGSLDDEFANIGQMYISFSPDIEVPAGKTLSIRMYSWNKHDFTLLMKDVVLSGETTTIPTGIRANAAAPSLKVYPTIASQRVHVESASVIKNIKVVSITGSVVSVLQANTKLKDVDVSRLNNGLYLFVVKTATGTGVQKVLVSR